MTPAQCANLLERHQTWRRYDGEIGGGPDMLPPKIVGEAIDAAIAMAHRFDDIGDLLCQALPYVENAIADPAYKGKRVAALAKRIETLVRELDHFGEANEIVEDTAAPAIVFFPCGSLGGSAA
ncbi:hypothetical protein [Azonexus sp.]|uniref:hypothetical protein n=1 Tax=Azonexus sp. TaxID=1872668 RepID=UPI0039E237F3